MLNLEQVCGSCDFIQRSIGTANTIIVTYVLFMHGKFIFKQSFSSFHNKTICLTCGIERQQTWPVIVPCCFCCRSLRKVQHNRPKVALDLEHQYKVDSTVTWWADSHQQRRYGADKEKVVFRSQNLNIQWWVFITAINAESSPLPRCICQSLWHCVSFWCVFLVINLKQTDDDEGFRSFLDLGRVLAMVVAGGAIKIPDVNDVVVQQGKTSGQRNSGVDGYVIYVDPWYLFAFTLHIYKYYI